MIRFRDQLCKDWGLTLQSHTNPDGLDNKITPFTHGSSKYTHLMKTVALKQALDEHGFDAAFGGARRDEEKSRAKERVYSFRDSLHQWDPKNQRPELWNLYNGEIDKGESIRVFPFPIGLSSTSGNISTWKRSPCPTSTSPPNGRWLSAMAP